jgi:sugar O-acyltransferase (sialic acid O-acetyltransferase NeuD family)
MKRAILRAALVNVVVLGAGGHARAVIEAVRLAAEHELVACTAPETEAGTEIDGVPVAGDDSVLGRLRDEQQVTGAVVGVGATHDNGRRARVAALAEGAGLELITTVHPRAIVSPSARLGPGTVVLAGAVVGPGAKVGANVIVNSGAIVEHDAVVEDHAHIAPGAVLGGAAVVRTLAHIGMNASVLQGIEVGAGAIVGAGAVVVDDVRSTGTVVGIPAREKGSWSPAASRTS